MTKQMPLMIMFSSYADYIIIDGQNPALAARVPFVTPPGDPVVTDGLLVIPVTANSQNSATTFG